MADPERDLPRHLDGGAPAAASLRRPAPVGGAAPGARVARGRGQRQRQRRRGGRGGARGPDDADRDRGWNRKETAEILGISYKALLYKIKENGLDKAS
ncbi:MAG: hypothetical protein DMF93_17350 [Acidobacteria bacterium]|nr:MAG: hypothetical protein DMF93_17350 [Acidobacteriota bacterium]